MKYHLNGLIEISIKQEHIDACHTILKYQEDLQKELDTYIVKSYLFGLIKKKEYPQIESTNPFVSTCKLYFDDDFYTACLEEPFEVLYTSIRYCKGETIFLSLDNYDTLCRVMELYKNTQTYNKKE